MKEKLLSLKGKVSKKLLCLTMSAMLVVGGAMSAFAEETTVNTADILSSGINDMKSDILGYVAIILPVALGIVGIFFGIKKAIAFFKSTAK